MGRELGYGPGAAEAHVVATVTGGDYPRAGMDVQPLQIEDLFPGVPPEEPPVELKSRIGGVLPIVRWAGNPLLDQKGNELDRAASQVYAERRAGSADACEPAGRLLFRALGSHTASSISRKASSLKRLRASKAPGRSPSRARMGKPNREKKIVS